MSKPLATNVSTPLSCGQWFRPDLRLITCLFSNVLTRSVWFSSLFVCFEGYCLSVVLSRPVQCGNIHPPLWNTDPLHRSVTATGRQKTSKLRISEIRILRRAGLSRLRSIRTRALMKVWIRNQNGDKCFQHTTSREKNNKDRKSH